MAKSKKLKCDSGQKSASGNYCLLVQGKGKDCEKKGCCIGCDEVATCKHPCGVALDKAGIEKKPVKKESIQKASRALEAHDIELMQRGNKTEQIEGVQPYNRELYIGEVRFLASRTVSDIMEAGKRLLVIKEKEGYGNFTKICEEEIGIPHSTAYRFMNAALKSGKFPKIDFKNFSHVGKV